ncbi:hypothetical protein BB560_006230 [Smittium megazygosporum]|uniref:Nudix hydrolase domain-containing protein n=1 Tax=Smittium megazygosporum TaxID=133381 RepID=A0A2T9YCX1_9FUNG|nr:hypothetical protein BB560_006230 [Smittium megazygosporum]
MNRYNNICEAVQNCDCVPVNDLLDLNSLNYRFNIDSTLVGIIKNPEVVVDLDLYKTPEGKKLFCINVEKKTVTFEDWCKTRQERQNSIDIMLADFRKNQIWHCMKKWRNEQYPIYGSTTESDGMFLTIERCVAEVFGIRTFGVHINGFVKYKDNQGESSSKPAEKGFGSSTSLFQIKMWVAKRSLTKSTYPGMLDQIVAGGISAGEMPFHTLIRECEEEAGIPENIASRAIPCGSIQYINKTENGYQPETQYVYDLELPQDFVPIPVDGEADSFELLDMERLKLRMLSGEYKPNCLCVVVDFMIRHGYITPENEPDYLNIIDSIHRSIPFPGPGSVLRI